MPGTLGYPTGRWRLRARWGWRFLTHRGWGLWGHSGAGYPLLTSGAGAARGAVPAAALR